MVKKLLNNVATLWLFLVVLSFCSLPAMAAKEADLETQLSKANAIMDTAISLVIGEAREEVSKVKMVNCAIDGMTLLLDENKLNSGSLKHVPDDSNNVAAIKELRRQFKATAELYPKLMQDQKLAKAALSGIMKATDDPYTVYMDPEAYKMLTETMSGGNFGGLGVVIQLDNDNNKQLTIVKTMPDSPAAKVGLKAKDKIVKIDGKSTKGMEIKQASELLRGETGSKVTITIERQTSAPFDVVMTREQIHVSTVNSKVIEQDNYKIGYIELNIFGESTNIEMEKAIRTLDAKGCQAYVLDVRDNSGGYVSAAVDVCSKFLPSNSRVVSIVERGNNEQVMDSHPNQRGASKPLVVLINKNSASASEITAGAIHDLNRGTLVGVKSFGKGSVQKLYPVQFPPGKLSAFKITTAHYHTPAGHDIHKAGIEPDVVIDMPSEDINTIKDVQLQKAVDVLVGKLEALTPDKAKPSKVAGAIKLNGYAAEVDYITNDLKNAGEYSFIDWIINSNDDQTLSEKVRVKTADGTIHTYNFDISECLGY